MVISDKNRKLPYATAKKRLIAGLHCGTISEFYDCFNVHHFQGAYSQGRGYTDNNGYWGCSTNCNHGCPRNPQINLEKVRLAVERDDVDTLPRKALLLHTKSLTELVAHMACESGKAYRIRELPYLDATDPTPYIKVDADGNVARRINWTRPKSSSRFYCRADADRACRILNSKHKESSAFDGYEVVEVNQ